MNDPWGSFQNFMGSFQQFATNPQPFMSKMGVHGNNPDQIIQQMMSSGKISQEQYNAARQAAQRIQSNPIFGQFMRGFKR